MFLDHGMVYTTPGLLASNGMHLSHGIFVQELLGLISRTLKQIPWGKGIKPGSRDEPDEL